MFQGWIEEADGHEYIQNLNLSTQCEEKKSHKTEILNVIRCVKSANSELSGLNGDTAKAIMEKAHHDNKKAALYLAQNNDVGQLALLAATAARYADNVERVVVEVVEDPESGSENLFVTAVVATEDFDVWDAIDEHVLSDVMEPQFSAVCQILRQSLTVKC